MQKILVINNDFDLLSLLKTWLEKKMYQVKTTTSHKEVPQLIRQFKPSLIIADVMQNETVMQLKADENTKDLPVLLMSGYTRSGDNNMYQADDYIAKPFNFPLFESKLKRLLRKAS